MITEIVNFIASLDHEVFTWGEKLKKGLYFRLHLDKNGTPLQDEVQVRAFSAGKKEDIDEFLTWCMARQALSKHSFSANRSFDSSKKIFIYTTSPFAFGFKKKSLNKASGKEIESSLDNYFRRAKEIIDPGNQNQVKWAKDFEKFCKESLFDWLSLFPEYKKIDDDTEVWIFLDNPSLEDYRLTRERYLQEMVLLKSETINEQTLGISDSISKFTDKKIFMAHQSAPFFYNRRIKETEGRAVWQFFELQKNGVFPNPLPIFIDKKELNGEVVRLYNNDEKKLSWHEIIKRLFEYHQSDLSNYYLIFFEKKAIADIDFVSSFSYRIDNITISNFFRSAKKKVADVADIKITNIFEFELKIANTIFDGQLIKNNRFMYFANIEPKHMSDTIYVLLLKYRKAFYDYIYKSRKQAITWFIFHDVMRQSILDLIRRDEDMKNDKAIREKMDIWFSLYSYFEHSNQNKIDMINKTKEILSHFKQAIQSDNQTIIRNDDDFAFASGQVIRYLLQQSKSTQRTHALLEPFLQKVKPEQFKLAIAKTFDTYKHELTLYGGHKRYAFDKLMSEVMGYIPDNQDIKTLIPMILAGYFAPSVLFRDPSNETSESSLI